MCRYLLQGKNGNTIVSYPQPNSVDLDYAGDTSYLRIKPEDMRSVHGGQQVTNLRIGKAVIGDRVFMVTAKSIENGDKIVIQTFQLAGTIKHVSDILDQDGRTITMVTVTYDSVPGDSGSPVFSATNGGLLGFHCKGGNKENYYKPLHSDSIGFLNVGASVKCSERIKSVIDGLNSSENATISASRSQLVQ
jgi:hypothetical protein